MLRTQIILAPAMYNIMIYHMITWLASKENQKRSTTQGKPTVKTINRLVLCRLVTSLQRVRHIKDLLKHTRS